MDDTQISTTETPRPKARLGKTRVAIAVFLCLPLLIATVLATTARFAGGRVLSDEAFTTYSANALKDPAVDEANGRVVGDKVLDVLDENHQKPEKVRDAIKAAAATVISTDEGRTIASGIFAAAHREFVATAERDDLTGDETMVVNFTPLVYRAMAAVADAKAFSFRSKLPAPDTLGDDAAMLSAMSKAVGRDLEKKAGTVRVIDQKEDGSDTAFKQIHGFLNLYHNGVNIASMAVLVLLLGVVFLFVRRRIGVIVASSVVLVAVFAPWIVLGRVPTVIVDSIDNEDGKAVAGAFIDPLVSDVRSRLLVVALLAVLSILVASFWTRIASLRGARTKVG